MGKLSKKGKKQLWNLLFLFLLISITLTVLLLSYQELNFKNILNFIRTSKWWLLALSVVCMIAGIVFEGLSLHIISRGLGHRGKVLPSIAYSSADIYYSAITPSASGGQPAAAYYMVKDGMSAGTASFTLVFNTVAYTSSLIILTVFAFALRPALFLEFPFMTKFLIIPGVVIQLILLIFLIGCMRFHKTVLKVCNGLVSLLVKIKIVKNEQKWRTKISEEVAKYAACFQEIHKRRLLFLNALILNTAQRVVRIIISCCICLAAAPDASFWSVFALQSFIIVGYTSLPVPGGVGAFEYLYLRVYRVIFTSDAFILSAMMVMRTVSYYLSIVVSGVITLGFHIGVMHRKPKEAVAEAAVEHSSDDAPPEEVAPPEPQDLAAEEVAEEEVAESTPKQEEYE